MTEPNKSQSLVRVPPHSDEAEKGLIGSILQLPGTVIDNCSDRITSFHFFMPQHQTIFAALLRMHDADKPIDLITLTQFLADDAQLELVGGASYVTHLFNFVPTPANAEYYIDIIRRKFIRREIIATCTELVQQSYEDNQDEHTLLDAAQARVTALAQETINQQSMRHVADGVGETLDKMDRIYHNRGDDAVDGYSTGIIDFDRMTTGLKPQQLIVIAARPSAGKTALGMNIAVHMALENKMAVAVFSMEMSYTELSERIVCSVADVSLQRLRDGFLGKDDLPKIIARASKVREAPLYIDDSPKLWITDFKARARRAVTRLGVKAIIVDYLQLMVSPSRRAQENRVLEITEITGGLKACAKELNIPIIVMAQLNREAEKRAFGLPKLSDLRESGSIEQDADIVALIWRPIRHVESSHDREKLCARLKCEDDDLETYAELIVAKQRNGPVGNIKLRFESDITQFQNVTAKSWSNKQEERQQ